MSRTATASRSASASWRIGRSEPTTSWTSRAPESLLRASTTLPETVSDLEDQCRLESLNRKRRQEFVATFVNGQLQPPASPAGLVERGDSRRSRSAPAKDW